MIPLGAIWVAGITLTALKTLGLSEAYKVDWFLIGMTWLLLISAGGTIYVALHISIKALQDNLFLRNVRAMEHTFLFFGCLISILLLSYTPAWWFSIPIMTTFLLYVVLFMNQQAHK